MQPEPTIRFISRRLLLYAGLVTVLVLQGCAARVPHTTDSRWIGFSESGKASYYAMKFQFRRTASGERLNNLLLTAAHKTLPFGTRVRVTNVKNGRPVVVTINDRGPFIKGRIIDLTNAAFAKIASIDQGIVKVKIEVIP